METGDDQGTESVQLRVLGRNAILYGIGNIAVKTGTFLLIPLFTRALSMGDYGLLATAMIVQQILALVVDCGARTSLVRFAKEAEQSESTGVLVGTSLLINLIGGLIVGILLVSALCFGSLGAWIPIPSDMLLRVTVCAVFQSLFQTSVSYFRAKNDGWKYLLPNVALTGLILGSNWIGLQSFHCGVLGVLNVNIGCYCIMLFILLPILGFNESLAVSVPMLLKLMRFGLPVVIVSSATPLADAVGFSILAHFRSFEEVAIYSIAAKFAEVPGILLMNPLQTSYEPLVYSNIGSERLQTVLPKLLTYILITFAFMSCATSFGALVYFRTLSPKRYIASYALMIYLLPMIGLRGVYSFGEVLLHSKNKTYITGALMGVGSLLCMILNRILIPRTGVYGNVLVSDVVSLLIASAALWCGVKTQPISLEMGKVTIASVIFIALGAGCRLMQNDRLWYSGPILTVVVMSLITFLFRAGYFEEGFARRNRLS